MINFGIADLLELIIRVEVGFIGVIQLIVSI